MGNNELRLHDATTFTSLYGLGITVGFSTCQHTGTYWCRTDAFTILVNFTITFMSNFFKMRPVIKLYNFL